MSDDADWSFGRKEIVSIAAGSAILPTLSLVLGAAPPWWFLPLPRRAAQQLDTWELYAQQGGYEHFWLQSLIGWLVLGAVAGLVFSNVVLRRKSWDWIAAPIGDSHVIDPLAGEPSAPSVPYHGRTTTFGSHHVRKCHSVKIPTVVRQPIRRASRGITFRGTGDRGHS